MSKEANVDDDQVVVECDLDAPQDRVWRALTTPELAADWLNSTCAPASPEGNSFEIVDVRPYSRVVYRWHEIEGQDTTQSFVTVDIERRGVGSTWFRLTHKPPRSMLIVANSNMRMARAA